MGKGRIQHGLIEAIGGERFYLLHRKAEQPCFQIHRISMCGQLQAQLGMAESGKGQLVMQKCTVLHPQAKHRFVPGNSSISPRL